MVAPLVLAASGARPRGLAGATAAAQELEVVAPTYDEPRGRRRRRAPAPSRSTKWWRAAQRVFGEFTQAFAAIVERAVSSYGLPNGYIVGEEAGGALIGGVRYGEGILYTRNAGQHRVYWQGPSLGFDIGANGNRVMMMVYNLPSVEAIYNRYRRGQRLGLCRRRARHDGAVEERNLCRSGGFRSRRPARRQFRLHQVHHAADLEPVLTAVFRDIACVDGRNVAGGARFRVKVGVSAAAPALPEMTRHPPASRRQWSRDR